MALNIKNRNVEQLAAEVARLAGESKTEAVRRALEERRERLAFRVVRRDRTAEFATSSSARCGRTCRGHCSASASDAVGRKPFSATVRGAYDTRHVRNSGRRLPRAGIRSPR